MLSACYGVRTRIYTNEHRFSFFCSQGQTYAVPHVVEMSEDWVARREGRGGSNKASALVTVDPGDGVDDQLEKEMSTSTLVHVFGVRGEIPVIPAGKFE